MTTRWDVPAFLVVDQIDVGELDRGASGILDTHMRRSTSLSTSSILCVIPSTSSGARPSI